MFKPLSRSFSEISQVSKLPLSPEQSPMSPEQSPLSSEQSPLSSEQLPYIPEQLPYIPEQSPLSPEQLPLSPEQSPLSHECCPVKMFFTFFKFAFMLITPSQLIREPKYLGDFMSDYKAAYDAQYRY
jgi:hypothetical protein